MPTLYIIAGPNGVGKTTFADRYLPDEAKQLEFVNADLIARGLSPYDPDSVVIEAGKIAWDESFLDADDYRVERALQRAGLDALHRARRCDTDFVIWEENQVRSLKPHETTPYEKVMVENLDRLNRKIAQLEGQSPHSLALNERPKE